MFEAYSLLSQAVTNFTTALYNDASSHAGALNASPQYMDLEAAARVPSAGSTSGNIPDLMHDSSHFYAHQLGQSQNHKLAHTCSIEFKCLSMSAPSFS